jgi:hypothetical protein
MLGLDFVLPSRTRNASETGACGWGTVTQTEQTVNRPTHHFSTETVEPSFGNRRFCVRRGGQLY